MNITFNRVQGRVPVAVVGVQGDLDASNFEHLIAQGQEAYATGTRHILLDLTNTSFMSSSGLLALHSITLLMQGQPPPDLDHGWSALHDVGGTQAGPQPYVKLLNPQPKVERTLTVAGRSAVPRGFQGHAEFPIPPRQDAPRQATLPRSLRAGRTTARLRGGRPAKQSPWREFLSSGPSTQGALRRMTSEASRIGRLCDCACCPDARLLS
jgi:hypothetical protein